MLLKHQVLRKRTSLQFDIVNRLIFLVGIVFLITYSSCKKEEPLTDDQKYDWITDGCIPVEITFTNNWQPELNYKNKYIYGDDNLELIEFSFGESFQNEAIYVYTYSDGVLTKISYESPIGQERNYETYQYSAEGNLLSRQFFKVNSQDGTIEMTRDFEYEYDGAQITKINNRIDGSYFIYFYQPGFNRLDSLKEYNADAELLTREYYTYDNAMNIFSNFKIPSYNFFNNIRPGTLHNLINQTIIRSNSPPDTSTFLYDYTYNDNDYPVSREELAPNGVASTLIIEYTACQ